MLAKFSQEHTHSEDEVRFTVQGSGVFHIHPPEGPVFGVQVESGDLINVPAGTRHWFDLCEDRTIRCIRLFLDPAGWAPHYVDDPCIQPLRTDLPGTEILPRRRHRSGSETVIQFTGKGILLDIEGTTSSISFVYDEMFPTSGGNCNRFCGSNGPATRCNEPAIRSPSTRAMTPCGIGACASPRRAPKRSSNAKSCG